MRKITKAQVVVLLAVTLITNSLVWYSAIITMSKMRDMTTQPLGTTLLLWIVPIIFTLVSFLNIGFLRISSKPQFGSSPIADLRSIEKEK